MAPVHRVAFLTYPSSAPATCSRLVGIRVDGTDLRLHAADATFEMWRQEREAEGNEDTVGHRSFVRTRHNGLPLDELGDPSRHFLGGPALDFTDPDTGTTVVLGCSCGVRECRPLLAVVTLAPDTVTWSGFRRPFRPEWGELPVGPYVFFRPAYEAALATPVQCTEDPLSDLWDGPDEPEGEPENDRRT
jgi:hypothetical protein